MNCIIFGGVSPEHEISIISAFQVKEFLSDVHLIYFDKENQFFLADKMSLNDFKTGKYKKMKKISFIKHGFKTKYRVYPLDVAIELIHGINGEDGCLSGFLRLYDIPYVGCDVYSGALFMNKYLSHLALKEKGYDVTNAVYLTRKQYIFREYSLSYPCILKPNQSGSSIGIAVCYNDEEFIEKANDIFKITDEIIIEDYLEDFAEYNVAVSRQYVSNCHKICNKGEIFSFEDKYESEFKLKNTISHEPIAKELQDLAKKIYQDFNLRGIIRCDFLVTKDKIYICELNTIPGALSSYMFDDFSKVIEIELHRARYENLTQKHFLQPIQHNLFKLNKFTK